MRAGLLVPDAEIRRQGEAVIDRDSLTAETRCAELTSELSLFSPRRAGGYGVELNDLRFSIDDLRVSARG